jgi:hypothetical protein
MKQETNNKIKRKSGKKETNMEKTTTNNKFLVNIIDTKNGGSIGVVWDMTSTEIDSFNADNKYLQAIVIDR